MLTILKLTIKSEHVNVVNEIGLLVQRTRSTHHRVPYAATIRNVCYIVYICSHHSTPYKLFCTGKLPNSDG